MSGERQPSIRIDETGVTRQLSSGKVEHVAWQELVEVSIVTTDEGPFTDDMFYLLIAADGSGCVVPSESPECARLVERLHQLPGFDYNKAIEAATSTANARFVCWRKDSSCSS